ncbi:hypothetical protein NKJ66_26965 [Mesorhizobium sp. M0078]|uniref:hypothetical protein n=1 Tax=Mesorhizobium sp. M0078 TaxID=2956871 RepID=UPI0033365270
MAFVRPRKPAAYHHPHLRTCNGTADDDAHFPQRFDDRQRPESDGALGGPITRSFGKADGPEEGNLRKVRGLEPKTREGILLGGRRFLDWFRHHHPGQNLEALTAEHVLAAVEHRLSLSATTGTRTAATFFSFYVGLAIASLAFGAFAAAPCMG